MEKVGKAGRKWCHRSQGRKVSIIMGEQCKILEMPEKCPLDVAIRRVGARSQTVAGLGVNGK